MQTWLDWAVQNAANASGMSFNDLASECLAARVTVSQRWLELRTPGYLATHPESNGDVLLSLALFGFLDRDEYPQMWKHVHGVYPDPPLALRVSERLIGDFKEADAPQTDDWKPILRNKVTYLDFPHGTLLLGDAVQLRAVFISPHETSTSAEERFSVLAVATGIGLNRPVGNTWWGMSFGRGRAVDHTDIGHLSVKGTGYDGLGAEYVQNKVENLIVLTLLFYQTAEAQTVARLPRLAASYVGKGFKGQKKYSAKRAKHSIFSVTVLTSPEDRFGRKPDSSGTSWHLQYRVHVRGHFRWQAWGPHQSRRRLQWIEAHERGPAGAPELHRLNVLK